MSLLYADSSLSKHQGVVDKKSTLFNEKDFTIKGGV